MKGLLLVALGARGRVRLPQLQVKGEKCPASLYDKVCSWLSCSYLSQNVTLSPTY
jgi:hypothetical protein